MTITILNWQRYQISSAGTKYWLKLHVQLLRSPDIMDGLTAAGRWVWLGLLLLALGREGQVLGSNVFIARQIGIRMNLLNMTLQKLIDLNLVRVSQSTASYEPMASPSGKLAPKGALERDKEEEKEKKKSVFFQKTGCVRPPLRSGGPRSRYQSPPPTSLAPAVAVPLEQRALLTERSERYRKNIGRAPSEEVLARWRVRLARGERL